MLCSLQAAIESYYSTVSNSFFFNDTATTEIYTLSLHDALPICRDLARGTLPVVGREGVHGERSDAERGGCLDRKSTRLNSSHSQISYAVFCLKKKKKLIVRHLMEISSPLNEIVSIIRSYHLITR